MPLTEEWLESLNMKKHAEIFNDNGYDDYESLLKQMISNRAFTDHKLYNEFYISAKKDRDIILQQLQIDAKRTFELEIPETYKGDINF